MLQQQTYCAYRNEGWTGKGRGGGGGGGGGEWGREGRGENDVKLHTVEPL